MNVGQWMKQGQRVLVNNSPAILTAFGVAGTVTTAILAGKASWRAADKIADLEENVREGQRANLIPDVTNREKFDLVWKLYIPAAGVGIGTISCIVLANRIGMRRTAALAAAYTLSERAFSEYSEKVVEKWGEKEEREIRTEVARERVKRDSVMQGSTIVVSSGNQLCHDAYSGRFFQSNMEAIRRAENNINRQIMHENYATVSNFYNNIGLEHTSVSDEMGWNTDKFLEILFDSILIEDEASPYHGHTALSFDFAVVPHRNPWFLP